MPRYFFSFEDGERCPDKEGVELAGLADVRSQAVLLLGELLRERSEAFWETQALTLTVTDHNGLVLLRIDVSGTRAPASRLVSSLGSD